MNNSFMPSDCADCPRPPQTTECNRVAYQYADLSIPLDICPDTDIGRIESECCGEPYVECETCGCGESCKIVINQSIKIKIPVKFSIKVNEGESYIKCGDGCCD